MSKVVFCASRALLGLLLCLVLLTNCAPLIAEYNAEAYKNATTLKAETLALVDKSGESYSTLKSMIEAHTTKINAAYEYSAGLPSNQLSTQQWQFLRDPNGNLYGLFLKRWRERTTLVPGTRLGWKEDLGDAFDLIICLEANKKEARSCSEMRAPAKDRPEERGPSR